MGNTPESPARTKLSAGRELDPPAESLEIELDMSVPHGAIAAKPRRGGHVRGVLSDAEVAAALRVAGQVKTEPGSSKEAAAPEVNKPAPWFKAITYNGRMVELSAMRGRKIWLIFYRYATCPLCNLHLARVASRYDVLKKAGVEVVGIFDSPVPSFFQPGGSIGAPLPLISDTDKMLYRLYHTRSSLFGVFRPSVAWGFVSAISKGFRQGKITGDFGQLPSHFLIDEQGVIRVIHGGKTAVDHIPWSSVGLFAKISKNELLGKQ